MPVLKQFYEQHRDDDRFEIIAFHDARAKTLAEMDAQLTDRRVREQHWDGEDLPFPIFMDATGKTLEQYRVHAFPTTILIDPEGRLVGETRRTEMLKQALAGELPPVRPYRIHQPSEAEQADAEWQALPAPTSDRDVFLGIAILPDEISAAKLLSSKTFNPGRTYIDNDRRSGLAPLLSRLLGEIDVVQEQRRSTLSEELLKKMHAGELRQLSEFVLTAEEQREVQQRVEQTRRRRPDMDEENMYRNAKRDTLRDSRSLTGEIHFGPTIYLARPEELPESTKLSQKLRALQVDVVKVLAEWFRESGALTEEEVGAIPRRFQRFADRSIN